jgi:hypothetical protein
MMTKKMMLSLRLKEMHSLLSHLTSKSVPSGIVVMASLWDPCCGIFYDGSSAIVFIGISDACTLLGSCVLNTFEPKQQLELQEHKDGQVPQGVPFVALPLTCHLLPSYLPRVLLHPLLSHSTLMSLYRMVRNSFSTMMLTPRIRNLAGSMAIAIFSLQKQKSSWQPV